MSRQQYKREEYVGGQRRAAGTSRVQRTGGSNRTSYRQQSTVGNNAVQLGVAYPLPDYEEDYRPKRKPRTKEADVYRTAPRKDANYAKVNRLCTIVLAFVIIATLGVLVVFLKSHFSVTDTTTEIENIKKQLNQVRRENIQMEEELESLVDMDYIYEVATTRLGMRKPGANEVFHIDNKPVSYTTKYGSVEVVEDSKFSITDILDYIKQGW